MVHGAEFDVVAQERKRSAMTATVGNLWLESALHTIRGSLRKSTKVLLFRPSPRPQVEPCRSSHSTCISRNAVDANGALAPFRRSLQLTYAFYSTSTANCAGHSVAGRVSVPVLLSRCSAAGDEQ